MLEGIKAYFKKETYLGEQALEVYRLLKNEEDWELANFWMNNDKENISLKVGFGFFQFDVNDGDYLNEFSLIDKLILWPIVKKLRIKLKRQERLEKRTM